MKIQPTDNISFNAKYYQKTIKTSYGKCIKGKSGDKDYDIHVAIDHKTRRIMHKLYCITKDHTWLKSFLRYFSGDKLHKEIRSVNNKLGTTTNG